MLSHFPNMRIIKVLSWIIPIILLTMISFSDDIKNQTSFFSIPPPWISSKNSSHRHSLVLGIPRGEKVVVADLEGPALINHIWITAKSVIPQVYGLMVLRIWWDGEESPSVEVPVGDFFGLGFGKEKKFQSLMLEMYPAGGEHHAALNSYWKTPFKKSAKIEIENRSFRAVSMFFIQVDYEKYPSLPDELLYFHAQYRRENPVILHKPYTILEAAGKGNYVGTIMNYHLLGPGAWVEGGQDFYIDGETKPSLPGIGAEDYFGHAWGFRTETNGLFHGTSFGPEDNKMTAYRFHIPDPVRFKKSIRATMKCHGWDVQDRQDDYSSIALWYQTEPHAKFPQLPPPDFDLLEVPDIYRMNPMNLINEKMKTIPFKGENLSKKAKDCRVSGYLNENSSGKMALDENMETKWCEIDHPDAHWLSLDLERESIIEGFVIISPSAIGGSPGFDLLGFKVERGNSWEGPWEMILEKKLNPEDSQTTNPLTSIMILPLPKPVQSRFIRLRINDSCSLDSICRIQEFQVWGKTSSNE